MMQKWPGEAGSWVKRTGKTAEEQVTRVKKEKGAGGGITKNKEKGKEFYGQERFYSSCSSVQPTGEWGLNSNLHKTIQAHSTFSLAIFIY